MLHEPSLSLFLRGEIKSLRPPRSEYNYRSAATASSLHPHQPYYRILFNGDGELDIAVGDEVALGGCAGVAAGKVRTAKGAGMEHTGWQGAVSAELRSNGVREL